MLNLLSSHLLFVLNKGEKDQPCQGDPPSSVTRDRNYLFCWKYTTTL